VASQRIVRLATSSWSAVIVVPKAAPFRPGTVSTSIVTGRPPAGTGTVWVTTWPASVWKVIVAVAAALPKFESEKNRVEERAAHTLGEVARERRRRHADVAGLGALGRRPIERVDPALRDECANRRQRERPARLKPGQHAADQFDPGAHLELEVEIARAGAGDGAGQQESMNLTVVAEERIDVPSEQLRGVSAGGRAGRRSRDADAVAVRVAVGGRARRSGGSPGEGGIRIGSRMELRLVLQIVRPASGSPGRSASALPGRGPPATDGPRSRRSGCR
jgi:hypothetical protein